MAGFPDRLQLSQLALTGAANGTDLTVAVAGGKATSIGSVSIAGTGIHDISLAAAVGTFTMTNVGFHDLTVGDVRTAFQLVGDGHDLTVGNILAEATIGLTGNEHDVTLGTVQTGAGVTLAGTEHDFTAGDIRGNFTVTASFHDGTVGKVYTGGHVILQAVGHQFTTASKKAANATWSGFDLALADGGSSHSIRPPTGRR